MRYLRRNRSQNGIQSILLVLAVLTFIPLFFLINLSLKDQFSFSSKPMSLSIPPAWSNYELAWQFMRDPLWHNVVVGLVATSVSLLMAALTSFVLARFRFPGRNLLMGLFLLILFVPSTILLVPTFELIVRFHLQNTLWALILPYAAHQSLMIFVLQSFFADLPAEMFDAAQMDGASVWQQFWRVAVPLALPALSAMAIFQIWWIWNDYAWPNLVANSTEARTAVTGVIYFNDGYTIPIPGAGMATAVIAAIPMLILFVFTMRTFIAGLTAGAVKQ